MIPISLVIKAKCAALGASSTIMAACAQVSTGVALLKCLHQSAPLMFVIRPPKHPDYVTFCVHQSSCDTVGAEFHAAMDAVSYKREVILVTTAGAHYLEFVFQLHHQFRRLGIGHFLLMSTQVRHNIVQQACSPLHAVLAY